MTSACVAVHLHEDYWRTATWYYIGLIARRVPQRSRGKKKKTNISYYISYISVIAQQGREEAQSVVDTSLWLERDQRRGKLGIVKPFDAPSAICSFSSRKGGMTRSNCMTHARLEKKLQSCFLGKLLLISLSSRR